MGRPMNPIPAPDSAVGRLAQALRDGLNAKCIGFRRLAEKVRYDPTALQRAASGKSVLSWPVARAFANQCDLDEAHIRKLWEAARREKDRQHPRGGPPRAGVHQVVNCAELGVVLATLRVKKNSLLVAVLVTAASVSDNAGGIQVLSQIAKAHPRVGRRPGRTPATAPRPSTTAPASASTSKSSTATPGQKGFKVIPRRWVVERTFGWLMHHRRLARDYEALPARSEAMISLAMIDLMSRRLTREATLNWRST
ncbi:hypothetical protein GCM10017562_00870 [Streptomyces roseofulvus]